MRLREKAGCLVVTDGGAEYVSAGFVLAWRGGLARLARAVLR